MQVALEADEENLCLVEVSFWEVVWSFEMGFGVFFWGVCEVYVCEGVCKRLQMCYVAYAQWNRNVSGDIMQNNAIKTPLFHIPVGFVIFNHVPWR